MATVRKTGPMKCNRERKVIRRVIVIECCDKEAQEKSLIVLYQLYGIAMSDKIVKRIRKEAKNTPNERLRRPGKKRKQPDNHNTVVDDFDRRVILDVTKNFYINKEVVPTSKKFLPVKNTV
ncbi:hypothetical protein J6590_048476 [Homalodisca vitripennis]|nr:hypothetical protein J6590_048476 [Homalodisca vitripennis]